MNGFYAGFLHPVTALQHLLALLALGLVAGQQGERMAPALLVFALMLMFGAALAPHLPALPYIELLNLLSIVLLGALAVIAWRLPLALLYLLALALGLSHGYANGVDLPAEFRRHLFIAGVGLAGVIVPAWVMLAAEFILRQRYAWMHIALRVTGSWITAMGILVLATSGRALLHG